MKNQIDPSAPHSENVDQTQTVQLIPTTPPGSSAHPPQSMSGVWRTVVIVAIVLVTSIVSSGVTAWIVGSTLQSKTNTQEIKIVDQEASQGTAVVQKIADSVVSINTTTVQSDWFGRQRVSEGAGSGVIVSSDGYVLTNNHVIDGANTVYITTTDDHEYAATVVETDEASDLALLKIKDTVTRLMAAEIGDSSSVKVGDAVYAVGNALGQYPNSVTAGIISGLGRPITASSSGLRGNLQEFEDLIQTDAAINSGNSGGPLVNSKGQVIGINTAVAGQAQNIGFSVPIARAQALIDEAREQ